MVEPRPYGEEGGWGGGGGYFPIGGVCALEGVEPESVFWCGGEELRPYNKTNINE